MARSPLKWVGGKAQIIDEILELVPARIHEYHECFLGGATVLITILERVEAEKMSVESFLATDANQDLIDFYVDLRDHTDELVRLAESYVDQYNQSPIPEGREKRQKIVPADSLESNIPLGQDYVYYHFRQEFNRLKNPAIRGTLSQGDRLKKSALFLVVNKTCWRGVYRESKTKFNVPFGNYDSVSAGSDNLARVAELFRKYNVKFLCQQFDHAISFEPANSVEQITKKLGETKLEEAKPDASAKNFVYLDPPYYPLNETSFTSYTSTGFGIQDHENLVEVCHCLNESGKQFLLSNSNTLFIQKAFADKGKFQVKEIMCRRSIHSKTPQVKSGEVLVYNQ